ncbi:hypothetical protein VB776_07920 [Arcicella sp. DC2W]|uniref:Lipoprotein n=1 Tax=Arcicella gelida TaxID=2984195 RepID=A0ABU5S2W5_9BACT|nr:hypothetical protein [Arcicella sp. DC2W]MEA5402837.1 hypothetical protein [Arcicella sp. DC2W]
MKRITQTLLVLTLLASCETQDANKEVHSQLGDKNMKFINELDINLATLEKSDYEIFALDGNKSANEGTEFGKKVGLYQELVDLFDPENFNCGCDKQMKKALKKLKPKNQVSGFIPDDVSKNAFMADTVSLLAMQGSNILAHLFQYENSSRKSKPLFAKNANSVKNFNVNNFIEKKPETYDQFLYTLDCTGFITAAVNATGGVSAASIKTAASVGVSAKKSLFVLGGVMYSPLYQAFKGEGIFKGNDSLRINVLGAILDEIPTQEQSDNTKILINANYKVILTSNSGNSNFNGEGSFGASGNASFGFGSVQIGSDGSGSIGRTSSYTSYKTYIIQENINTKPLIITVKNVNDLIAQLKNS